MTSTMPLRISWDALSMSVAWSDASSPSTDVQLEGTVIRDRYGDPINFGHDQQTTDNLLRVVEAQKVRVLTPKNEHIAKD
jgi:hypothetical protein